MNRRDLFKGLIGVTAGLILPPTLEENAEAGRRIWALGGIPEEPQSLQKLAFLNTGEIYFERWAQGFDGQMHLVQSRRIATVTQEYPHA